MVDNINRMVALLHIMPNKFVLFMIKIKLNLDVLIMNHKYGNFLPQKPYKFNLEGLMIHFYHNTRIV